MAECDCVTVQEQVVVPDPVVAKEVVTLPGEKGDKGDPFTYDDFTPEQIAELQRPATEAAAVANQAAEKANKAAESMDNKVSEIIIDLYDIIGTTCYRVYRFDDDCLYILHSGGITKCDKYFNIIYTLKFRESFNRKESGLDRNLFVKIGNKIFMAVCDFGNLIYMYDEDSMEGKYLDNPESLQYYGSIYAIGEKVYYFHRYEKKHIYIYNDSGELLKSMDNPYKDLKYSGGVAFTNDFHKFNTALDEFEGSLISFPDAVNSNDLQWIFSNENMVAYKAYGFNITDRKNSISYNFTNTTFDGSIFFAKNKNEIGSLICNRSGIYIFYYPYNVTNAVGRQYQFISFNKEMIFATEYNDKLYCTTSNNLLVIKNIRYLNYDTN